MSKIFGIDLGTTYSAIAHINEMDQPEVIRNPDNDSETTPSVIHFEESHNTIVGETAKNSAVLDVENVVQLIKRRMGTDYSVTYYGIEHTPETLSSLILKHLGQFAREQTGIDSNKVVITVPAYFGLLERAATEQAGEIAGLDVVSIVTEPVAAAMSYSSSSQQAKTLFVYDLGGGTFDTTIMRTYEDSRPIDVMVIDGNRELGGADWDRELSNILADKFVEAAALDEDPRDDDDFLQRLAEETEKAKKKLSNRMECPVILGYGAIRERVTVTRQEFEDATSHLLNTTLETVDRTLEKAMQKDSSLKIDEVLLVGGSTRMPAVKASLEARYPDWAFKLADPDLAVAKGAALYGAALDEQAAEEHAWGADTETAGSSAARTRYLASATVVNNVLPRGLGVGFVREVDGAREHYVGFIAHQNETLPIEKRHVQGQTIDDNATNIKIEIFEQAGAHESEEVANNREITPDEGAIFTNLPSLPKGSPIDFFLTIDNELKATLNAIEPRSQQQLKLEVTISVLQPDEVEAATEVMSGVNVRG